MIGELVFLARDAWQAFSWRIPLLVALMVVSGLLEGLAVTAALPLLTTLGASAPQSGFVATLGAVPRWFGLPSGPVGVGVLMVGLVMASAVAFLAQARYSAGLQVTYVARWQTRVFNAALAAEPTFLNERRGSDIVNALVTDSLRISGSFYNACIGIAAVANLVIYLILAMLVSPAVTALVVALGTLLLIVTRRFVARAYGYGAGITQASADVQALASEVIGAAKLVKACAAEADVSERFTRAVSRLALLNFKNAFDIQKAKAVFEFGGAAGIAALLIFGPTVMGASIATILVILALFVRLLPRVTALQQCAQALSGMLPALASVRGQLRDAERMAEPYDDRLLSPAVASSAPGIVFSGVRVVRGGREVLRGVDIEIPAGKIVAFVGASGSGKSTLVDAILGLVPLSAGKISIAGEDLSHIPLKAWRRSVGYVGQDLALLGGTIANNVAFGNGAEAVAIESALSGAAADFVAKLEAGSQTSVGDRGSRLSGGERQRLGFARALAAPRLVYIFDEATSALDSETEERILAVTAKLRNRATVLIVAHRFSAVKLADIIYTIEDGRCVESGSWASLDRPGSRFSRLKALQNG